MNHLRRTKVCVLSTVHPATDGRIFHKQAKTLVKAGYKVTLITQHDKEGIVNGVTVIALPKPRSRSSRCLSRGTALTASSASHSGPSARQIRPKERALL